MLVRVMYSDGRFDMIRNDMLDILVANLKIRKIRRASGWVDVDDPRVRRSLGKSWSGEERRAPWPELRQRSSSG